MRKGYYTILLTLVVIQVEANVCPEHCVAIGNFCYHFSDIKENWDAARGVCAGIGSLANEYILPAVLDLGSPLDNQLLLNKVNDQSKEYWLGGYLMRQGGSQSCDITIWQWIYHVGKEIDLHANYWMIDQPNTHSACVKTTTNSGGRSYIKTENCSNELNVICQIIPKEFGFRDVGGKKFYFSEENNYDKLNWTAARNECQALVPPGHFDFVDLAILDDNTGQELLKIIANHGSDVWLGGIKIEEHDKTLSWIDGSEISKVSYFLDSGIRDIFQMRSSFGKQISYYYTYAKIVSMAEKTRATLDIAPSLTSNDMMFSRQYTITKWSKLNFVSQAYKN